MTTTSIPERGRMAELALYFLRLGFLGFGGPVALVGQMERELVSDKKWLSKEQMRESIAICQSLPGPLAIQVGVYIAWLRCGFWGAWLGGWCFILPNFVIVAALGALYVRLGDLQPVTAIFYGVSPAVIALILHSCYRLAKLGMEDWLQWAIAVVCFAVTIILQAEVALLFIGAGIVGILYYGSLFKRTPAILPVVVVPAAAPMAPMAPVATGSTLGKLMLFFLKAGSLTFGSGLVIVPFLEQGLVQQYNWLDERQFLIAVAIGMISPGPVVITATFVGYLVAGFWGSLVSTVGIFLPSFLLVLIVAPILARHRGNANVQGFVKGAYAAAIGTILGACVLLGKIAIGDWLTAAIGIVSLAVLFRWKINNPTLIAATAVVGLIAYPLLQPAWVMVK
ncbi:MULTISPECIES: chromate efflux transporter [unclassified Bradyrhizobium]|uniref:chromate efflux transporter n=1 Tax=unclassified Bradyrhizobium TaxID=2631580 RepID=UPI00247AAF9D|nr:MULTISPECIES: chromate efflux transporter [unclassified Bradyrhizobium]WGR73920.1 chromate efflux transporter [Bradyrhizobium sp. ISRA426]WGR78757.1 chromate efflux transporter [Bradyrhizobium sp. ISRA430]WGR89159.1 chromate efflux transporter [Bradyrhizobium sp. ISRA432]